MEVSRRKFYAEYDGTTHQIKNRLKKPNCIETSVSRAQFFRCPEKFTLVDYGYF